MESLDPTLYEVLQSLYKNNGRKSWNMYPENNDSICLKIRFNGRGIGSTESNIKQKSPSKVRRNFNRAAKLKESTSEFCEPKPAKRNRSELSPDICYSSEIENPRNCAEPNEDPSLDHDLSSVDCTPIKTLNDSQLVDSAETSPPMDALNVCDHVKSAESETECTLQNDIEIAELDATVEHVDLKPQFDPYDNDNDSVYDENEKLPDWRQETTAASRPCIQPGCFYRPNKKIGSHEINQQLGPRPNGTYKSFYKCVRCGRIMCNECVYYKMRHINHFKHVKCFYRDLEPDPIPIDNIVSGFI